MRVLHTSDLHLGRTLFGVRRDYTFGKFLDWLCLTVKEQAVDLLIIAGDIFDTATPAHFVQQQYYAFLNHLISQTQCRHVVIVGGNHDSATLINAPEALLANFNIHVTGSACENPEDEVLLLKDTNGDPEALVLTVPYLREHDVRTSNEQESISEKEALIVEGTRAHYKRVLEAAQKKIEALGNPDIPLIATGHLFAAKCSAGDDERNLYVGSLGLIPSDVFDPKIDYVALGHLHRAQILDGNPTRRYCGSPVALDFSEKSAQKEVALIDFEGHVPTVSTLAVPAFDRMERVSGSEEEILLRLERLAQENEPMFCEVIHDSGVFAPQLAQNCYSIVAKSPVEIVRVVSRTFACARISSQDQITDVENLSPEDMFELRLSKEEDLDDAMKKELTAAYQEILEEIRHPELFQEFSDATQSNQSGTGA